MSYALSVIPHRLERLLKATVRDLNFLDSSMSEAETAQKLRDSIKDIHLLDGEGFKNRVAAIKDILRELEPPNPPDINGVTLLK